MKVVEEEGDISGSVLKSKNMRFLAETIRDKYPGKMLGLRKRLGLAEPDERQRGTNYWNPETIEKEAKEAIESGVQLNYSRLNKKGFWALSHAISRKYPGGIEELRKKLGLVEPQVSPDEADEMMRRLEVIQ